MTSIPLSQLGEPLEVPLLRREPYRLLFPLGAGFAIAGTLPWLLFSLGVPIGYPRVFHALVQVQAFLACFVGGFLMTFVPRRTGAAPPATWELAAAAVLPTGVVVMMGLGKVGAAESAWMAWLVVLLSFVLRRLRNAPMNPVPSPPLIWVPLSLLGALVGSFITGYAAYRGAMDVHDVAQRAVMQGTVAGLVLGIGSMLLPVLTRRSAVEVKGLSRPAHVVLALLFWASYALETTRVREAFALRAAVAFIVFGLGARLDVPPRQKGVHIWLAWLGAWMLPVGLAVVAAFPEHRVSALHLTFIGTFSVMAFSIGAHVTFAHGNRSDLLTQPAKSSLLVPFGAAMAVALVSRVGLDWSGASYMRVLGLASGAFLVGVGFWLAAVLPVAVRPPRRRE